VFPWLDELGEVVPWLATEESQALVEGDRPPAAPAPTAVRRTHDKAFAGAFADGEGYTPAALRGLVRAFDPSELADADAWIAGVERHLAAWPPWTGGRFTLKPRFGSSGRGRVAGRAGALDRGALRAALPRLARLGGVVLEPWLDRREDLATCLRIAADGAIAVVGSLRPWTSASGGLLGHRGGVDSRGRVFSESGFEEPTREAAAHLARAAADAGLRGPCGVDALVFALPDDDAGSEDPSGERLVLRPIVELNARFTAGLVTIGLIRRALPTVRRAIGLEPGRRRAFLLGLVPPPRPASDPWAAALERAGEGAVLLRLGGPPGAAEAALLFAESGEQIDAVLAPT
jgi:hypothetical protein